MKKTQKLIFAVVTMVLSLFLLTACGLQTHMHDYSEWGYNDENHWMYCAEDNVKNDETVAAHTFTERGTDETYHWMYCPTCGAIQQSSKGEHVDEDFDGKCDVCEHKVPVYADFSGKVTLLKGGSAPVSTNEGVTLTVTDDNGEAELLNYAFNEDGTFSFTADEGEYLITASKQGYVTAQGYIELNHEEAVTGYEMELSYKLLQVAPKPNYDPLLHDFSHMNDEKPYVIHTFKGKGKTLDVSTVEPQNNAMFTWYAEKGHACANGDRVGVWVQFYDDGMTKGEYIWFQVIGDNYQYAVYTGGGWGPAPNMMQGKSAYSAYMSDAEKAQFDKGELKITLGRSANYIFVIVNDELRDTIVLDEKYAEKDAYLGLVGWDVSADDGQNKFYFALDDLKMGKLTLNKTGDNADKLIVNGYKESYDFDDTTELTFEVEKGYYINSLTINGKLFDKTEVYALDLFNKDATLDIDVEIIEIATESVTFQPQEKYASVQNYTELTLGTRLVFANKTTGRSYTATYTGGKLVVDLEDGKYTVSAKGYYDLELTVTNGVADKSLDLYRKILLSNGVDEKLYTISLKDGKEEVAFTGNTFKRGYAYFNANLAAGKYTIEATYKGTAPWDDAISFVTSKGTETGYLINFGTWGDSVYAKWRNSNDYQVYAKIADVKQSDDTYVIKMKIEIYGNNITTYTAFLKTDGNYTDWTKRTFSFGNEYYSIGFTAKAASSYSDVTIVEETKYAVVVPTLENATVTADRAFAYKGESVVYTITPAEGYVVSSVTVNGVDKYGDMKNGKLTVENYNDQTVLAITVQEEKTVDVKVEAHEIYEGSTVTFKRDDQTNTVTIENGTATFSGLTGYWTATIVFKGKTYDFGRFYVGADGKLFIDETARISSVVEKDNFTYPNTTDKKATAEYSPVSGEGTMYMEVGDMLRHRLEMTYDGTVAFTMYLDSRMLAKDEEQGPIIAFDTGASEYPIRYVWFGIKTNKLAWLENYWHDVYDKTASNAQQALNITPGKNNDIDVNVQKVLLESLTSADIALYNEGKLPVTLVRSKNMVYAFVNGRYAGYAALPEEYATMTARVGISGLSLQKSASQFDFVVEDAQKYLDICEGATDFQVEIKGEGLEYLVVNGLTADGVYNMNTDYKFTFAAKDHPNAPLSSYGITSFKVNGEDADYTKAIEKTFYKKSGCGKLTIEVVVTEVARGTFEGKVELLKQGTTTVATKDFNLYLLQGEEEVELQDYKVSDDGTVSFKAFEGIYTLVVEYNKYLKWQGQITISDEEPIVGYKAVLDYNLLKIATKPGWDGALHDFTHQNEENAYVLHTWSNGTGKTLDFTTVDAVDDVMFSYLAKKGQSANGEDKVGICVQFYEANGTPSFLWFIVKGSDYKFEWQNDNLWSMRTLNKKGWGFQNGQRAQAMTDEEKELYEEGKLKVSVARSGNMVYAFVDGELADTIVLNERYASMDAYIGMFAYDPCEANGNNRFYFELTDFNPATIDVTVTAPAAYEGDELVFAMGSKTATATVTNGKATFKGYQGLCNVKLRKDGVEYSLGLIEIAEDGTATIADDVAPQYFDKDCMVYLANAGQKVSSTYDAAKGEGTLTVNGSMVRHKSYTSYDKVAWTVYMNFNNLSDAKEESGVLLAFGSEYLYFGFANKDTTGKLLSWQTNNWHDSGDGGSSNSAISMTKDASKCTNYLFRSSLTDDELALYKDGKLPVTLVRDGRYVYVFVNGEFVGYTCLAAKYEKMSVQVGLSVLGAVSGSTYNFKVETDTTAYLAKADETLSKTLISNGLDTDKYTITEDENGAKVVFTDKTFKSGYAIVNTLGSKKYTIEATYTGDPKWDSGLSF